MRWSVSFALLKQKVYDVYARRSELYINVSVYLLWDSSKTAGSFLNFCSEVISFRFEWLIIFVLRYNAH